MFPKVSLYIFIIFYRNETDNIEEDKIKDSLFKSYTFVSNYLKKIVFFEDAYFTLNTLFKLYSLVSLLNYVNDKLILFIFMNIIIFYFPIENKTDHFIFKIYMAIKQTIDGIIGLLIVIIPKYEKPKEENVQENVQEKEKQA